MITSLTVPGRYVNKDDKPADVTLKVRYDRNRKAMLIP